MLSIILFGRNDNHGYNYHKRLAISLNCIAEIISEADEILFVDYNSPNSLPTIVEAIQDTLTIRAKERLRILRVRPAQHLRFRTRMPLLEPVARNVAIRKAKNRWILSTNGDMVFVPRDEGLNLTQIVSNLEDGFYTLPRLELPEGFWELSLNRLNPAQTLSFLRNESHTYHLNSIVRRDDLIRYDNPGDFQLTLREDLLRIGGFDEEMVQGWHVDSNLMKRLSLVQKPGASLEKILKGYHCNHTQKVALSPTKKSQSNDWNYFVTDVKGPIANDHKPWGLAEEEIEEIRFDSSHLNRVLENVGNPPPKEYEFSIQPSPYNQLTYSSDRIFVYLADHLMHLPKNAVVAYVGDNLVLLHKIAAYLEAGVVLCLSAAQEVLPPNVKIVDLDEMIQRSSLFIFDFGVEEKSEMGRFVKESRTGYLAARQQLRKVLSNFFKVVENSRTKPSTPMIGIQVAHSDFHVVFSRHLQVYVSSYIMGMTHGILNKKPSFQSTEMALRYFVTRYLFNYADPIRRFVKRITKS